MSAENYKNPIKTYEDLRLTFQNTLEVSQRVKYLILSDIAVDIRKSSAKYKFVEAMPTPRIEMSHADGEAELCTDINAWMEYDLSELAAPGKCTVKLALPSITSTITRNYEIEVIYRSNDKATLNNMSVRFLKLKDIDPQLDVRIQDGVVTCRGNMLNHGGEAFTCIAIEVLRAVIEEGDNV